MIFSKRFFSEFLKKYSENQVKTLADKLILVDENDKVIGGIDKLTAHTNSWIYSPQGHPHRAFSTFVFDEENKLLLQKRSKEKITFPEYWSNSCCSHPVKSSENDSVVKEATSRILYELGINLEGSILSSEVVSKIIYRAKADNHWGEYELDYLIFIKGKNLNADLNPSEVADIKWINADECLNFVKNTPKVSPWFKIIVEKTDFLEWWRLYSMGSLPKISIGTIEKFID